VLIAAMLSTGQGLPTMAQHWGNGFWNLLAFTMQMSLILVTGHALARAPAINRLLDRMARIPQSPGQAIVLVTLVALAGSWINWGFGLVIGAVFARALARQVRGVDYPLLVASAYSGFLIWHGGFSGSIPLSLASGGADLEKMTGGALTEAIGVGQTLFASYNLIIIAVLVVGLPLLNWAMQPKTPKVVDPALLEEPQPSDIPRETGTQRLDDSRILGLIMVALAVLFFYRHFSENERSGAEPEHRYLDLSLRRPADAWHAGALHARHRGEHSRHRRHSRAVPFLRRDHGDDGRRQCGRRIARPAGH